MYHNMVRTTRAGEYHDLVFCDNCAINREFILLYILQRNDAAEIKSR